MWELDCEESWALKNWCFWTVVLEKTLESLLDCKEIQPVHPKGDQPWVFFGRNDAKAETPVLWLPHVKSWLTGKDSDAWRDWGQEEKGTTEDEMAGWHHGLDGREFMWTPGVGDRQGGLVCCNSWGQNELDMTEPLNWTELNWRTYRLTTPTMKKQRGTRGCLTAGRTRKHQIACKYPLEIATKWFESSSKNLRVVSSSSVKGESELTAFRSWINSRSYKRSKLTSQKPFLG